MEIVSFSNHPDDDDEVAKVIDMISRAGGVKEIWKPDIFGIVTKVEDYYLDEKTRQQLHTQLQHEQKVNYIATNGHTFAFGWNNQKPFRNDVNYRDFPDGFKENDCIHVKSRGASITSVERVSLDEIKTKLPNQDK